MMLSCFYLFFFKHKTAYEMRISDWSSDVCSSDLLAYFEFPRRLVYQAVDSRLVTWDEEEYIFEYDTSLVTDEEKAAALAKATNWILSRHEDVVAEGARATVYKRLSDTERARTSYSMYMSLRGGFWSNEDR